MVDTAQPFAAAETDPNAQLANAAEAFKAFTSDQPIAAPEPVRNERGQYASAQPEEPEDLDPSDSVEPETDDAEDDGDAASDEEAQRAPMPPSWGQDDAELWAAIPPEAQAKIAEREGERDRAVNVKFQEIANTRKTVEAEFEQVKSTRSNYTQALEVLMQMATPQEPDPRMYGAGTGQFDAESYELARAEYAQQANVFAQLYQQHQQTLSQQQDEDAQRLAAWKQEHEAAYAPRFVADVPELNDPVRAPEVLRGIVDYADNIGLGRFFTPDQHQYVTSDVLHALWKAQQFDKMQEKAKASPPPAKPKPAGPTARPGVSSPRSAGKQAQRQRAFDRLATDGSIEAGAAVFKNIFSQR